jgi:DNA mismatch repair protein MutS2
MRRELQRAATERAAAAVGSPAPQEQVREVEGRLRELTRRASARPQHIPRAAQAPDRPLAPGDTVLLRSLGSTGRVLSVGDGSAEVQLGNLKTRVRLDELQLQASEPRPERGRAATRERAASAAGHTRYNLEARSAPPLELDLRGQRAEAVTEQLDRYVDDAYLAGMPMLRIIHGKGTGALRQVVRQFLSDHPLVASVESGGEKGGEGVTVATLASR